MYRTAIASFILTIGMVTTAVASNNEATPAPTENPRAIVVEHTINEDFQKTLNILRQQLKDDG